MATSIQVKTGQIQVLVGRIHFRQRISSPQSNHEKSISGTDLIVAQARFFQ